LTADEALAQLLGGTGLVYRYVDDRAVTILPAGSEGAALPVAGDDSNEEKAAAKEGTKSSSGDFPLLRWIREGVRSLRRR